MAQPEGVLVMSTAVCEDRLKTHTHTYWWTHRDYCLNRPYSRQHKTFTSPMFGFQFWPSQSESKVQLGAITSSCNLWELDCSQSKWLTCQWCHPQRRTDNRLVTDRTQMMTCHGWNNFSSIQKYTMYTQTNNFCMRRRQLYSSTCRVVKTNIHGNCLRVHVCFFNPSTLIAYKCHLPFVAFLLAILSTSVF